MSTPRKISSRDVRAQLAATTACVENAVLPAIAQGIARDRALMARIEVLEAWMQAGLWARLVWLVRGIREKEPQV